MNLSDMALTLPTPLDENEGHFNFQSIGGDPPVAYVELSPSLQAAVDEKKVQSWDLPALANSQHSKIQHTNRSSRPVDYHLLLSHCYFVIQMWSLYSTLIYRLSLLWISEKVH